LRSADVAKRIEHEDSRDASMERSSEVNS